MTQEALKLALEALEEIIPHEDWLYATYQKREKAITVIKEALAKEKALQALHSENERLGLYKDAYAQPEPVVVVCCQQYDTCLKPCTPRGRHLAQRIWVGLKDEDISEIIRGTHNTGSFVRAITAKLKEKNCAG